MLIRTAKELGLLIRDRRRAMKLRQDDLAARLGVSRTWLIDVEHGKPTAAVGLVLRALTAVGVGLDAQFPGTSGPTPRRTTVRAGDVDAVVERARRHRRFP